jgi:hypothetical protein
LILAQLACIMTAIPATPTTEAPTRPAVRAIVADASRTVSKQGVVVVEAVYVRESADLSAPVADFLALGEVVHPLECVSLGDLVWVRHAQGWTVVRNRSAEYVTGVCLE